LSVEAENSEHQTDIQSGNEEIIRLLKSAVYLLEIIASVEIGTTIENFED